MLARHMALWTYQGCLRDASECHHPAKDLVHSLGLRLSPRRSEKFGDPKGESGPCLLDTNIPFTIKGCLKTRYIFGVKIW